MAPEDDDDDDIEELDIDLFGDDDDLVEELDNIGREEGTYKEPTLAFYHLERNSRQFSGSTVDSGRLKGKVPDSL